MSTRRQAAVIAGYDKENRVTVTTSKLIRWSGLAAVVAGIIFAGIQPIHPADELASVTTDGWKIIQPLKTAMCLLFVAGITGLYARQVEESGRLGLAGFLVFSLCWALQMPYAFTQAFIMPLLPTEAPRFVESFQGLASGQGSEMDLGALAMVYTVAGIMYMLGGLLFGLATFRAGVLPRWPAILLAVTATVTPAAALLPHDIQRLAAVPMGIALVWLGYALWSERREPAPKPAPGIESAQIPQIAAE